MKHVKMVAIIIEILLIILILGLFFINPKIEISEQPREIQANSSTEIKPLKTKYLFRDVTNNVKVESNIDYNKIGEYQVTYKVETLHGIYEQNEIIKVVDKKAPEIILSGEEEYNQSYSKEYEEPGYEAIDEHDGNLTSKVSVTKEEIGETEYNIKYEVSDISGNKASKIRKVKIIDDVPPEIKLNGNENVTLYLNSAYIEKGATAIDEKDGDLSEKIRIEGSIDSSKVGTYVIKYRVCDSKGNEAIKERTIKVKERPRQAQNGEDGAPGVIYLTFDDGPSSSITPQILDMLKEKNVKATFFIINYNSSGEKLVKRAYDEGHTIAIHGYSHEYSEIYQSDEAFMDNITSLEDKIASTTGGYRPKIIRFPGGSSNTVSKNYSEGIMTRLTTKVLESGYRYFDWNVSSGDAGGAKTSEDVYRNVTKGLSKSRSNVVLMHDFSGNKKTLNALADIIDYGIENGYTFSRITENTPMVTHSVNN